MRIIAILLCVCLFGCAPPAATTQHVPDDDDKTQSFAQLTNADSNLRAVLAGLPVTRASDLPGSGSAAFSGVALLNAEVNSQDLGLAGAVDLTVGFGSSTITGTIQSVKDEDNNAYTGTINVTNGTIDRTADPATEYSVFADMDGAVSGNGNTLDLSSDFIGDFYGSQGAGLIGILTGTTKVGGSTGYLFGSIVATGP